MKTIKVPAAQITKPQTKKKRFHLLWMNCKQTMKSPTVITLMTIVFCISLGIGIGLVILGKLVFVNDGIELYNSIIFPAVEVSMIVLFVSIFDIYYITKNFVNAKKNGVTDVEISSGRSRKEVLFTRLVTLISFSSVMILGSIFFYFLPTAFCSNASIRNLVNITSAGLLVVNVYNFFFIFLGIWCAISGKSALFSGIGTAIIFFFGMNPLWSSLTNGGALNTSNNSQTNWVYQLRDDLNDQANKHEIIGDFMQTFDEYQKSYFIDYKESKDQKYSYNNYYAASSIQNEISLLDATFNNETPDYNAGTNGYLYYVIRDANDHNQELMALREKNNRETNLYKFLNVANQTVQKQIKSNQDLYNNKEAVWSKSEYSTITNAANLSSTFGIHRFIKDFKKELKNSSFDKKAINGMTILLDKIEEISFAFLTNMIYGSDRNKPDNSEDNKNPNLLYYHKDSKRNQWISDFDQKEWVMTPGFRTFSLIFSLMCSSHYAIQPSYIIVDNQGWEGHKPLTDEEILDSLKEERKRTKLFLYLIPYETFNQTLFTPNSQKSKYAEWKITIGEGSIYLAIPTSFNGDINIERITYNEVTDPDGHRWMESTRERKMIGTISEQIYFNKFLAMFVYWLIGVGLVSLVAWWYYRRLII